MFWSRGNRASDVETPYVSSQKGATGVGKTLHGLLCSSRRWLCQLVNLINCRRDILRFFWKSSRICVIYTFHCRDFKPKLSWPEIGLLLHLMQSRWRMSTWHCLDHHISHASRQEKSRRHVNVQANHVCVLEHLCFVRLKLQPVCSKGTSRWHWS